MCLCSFVVVSLPTAARTFDRFRNLPYSWRMLRLRLIGIFVAFASSVVALPPYVFLEVIDKLPNFDKMSHRVKIDLVFNLQASLRVVHENRRVAALVRMYSGCIL